MAVVPTAIALQVAVVDDRRYQSDLKSQTQAGSENRPHLNTRIRGCFSFFNHPALLAGVSSPAEPSAITPAPGEVPAPPRLCLNCQAALTGPYCARCGQHDVDYHRSFHHLTHDLLENLFHFDGKFLVSVAWLLAKPGRLTNEFNAGRRQSQVPPLRFYIFATVLFFLGVHLLNHGHLFDFDRRAADQTAVRIGKNAELTIEDQAELGRRIVEAARASSAEVDEKKIAELTRQVRAKSKLAAEKIAGVPPADATPADASRRDGPGISLDQESTIERSLREKFSSGELTVSTLVAAIEGNVPTLLFLGMPLFALLLKLLHWRSGRYYIEHLIFSLHLHTWVFIAAMVGTGYFNLASLGPRVLSGFVKTAFFVWMAWYLLAAFRTVYGGGWRKTAFKVFVLICGYSAALTGLSVLLIFGTIVWLAYN